jgi:hypothetical protein
MEQFCRTRSEQEEWRAKIRERFGDDAFADRPEPADPLVEFRADIGLYAIGHIALAFCPWCGTDLKPRRADLDKLAKFSN